MDSHEYFKGVELEAKSIEYLQGYDNYDSILYAKVEELNETGEKFHGLAVTVVGGWVIDLADKESSPEDLGLEPQIGCLKPNTAPISGTYSGEIIIPDDEFSNGDDTLFHLFHRVEVGESCEYDSLGNRQDTTYYKYITSANSKIRIEGPFEYHSNEIIRKDGFCLEVDKIIFSSVSDKDELNIQFQQLVKMFEIKNAHGISYKTSEMMKHRLSYFNSTEYIKRLEILAPFFVDNEDDREIINYSSKGFKVDPLFIFYGSQYDINIEERIARSDPDKKIMFIYGYCEQLQEYIDVPCIDGVSVQLKEDVE